MLHKNYLCYIKKHKGGEKITEEKIKRLGYQVDEKVKEDFESMIKKTYGQKRFKCKSEIELAMKILITLRGGDDYEDDPEIQNILDTSKLPISAIHTQSKTKKQKATSTGYHGNTQNDIKDLLFKFDNEFYHDEFITKKDLRTWIAGTFGFRNHQTIRSRMDILAGNNRFVELESGELQPIKYAMNYFDIPQKEGNSGF